MSREYSNLELYFIGIGAKSSQGFYWSDRKYPFQFFNMVCHGNESSLFECQYDSKGSCSIYGALAVSCQRGWLSVLNLCLLLFSLLTDNIKPVNCTDGDVRLYGGDRNNSGIVLICTNKVWKKICRTYYYFLWNVFNTNVVCRQLGYSIFGNFYDNDYDYYLFSIGNTYRIVSTNNTSAAVYYERISCRGTENRLTFCISNFYYTSSLNCHETIEITCSG